MQRSQNLEHFFNYNHRVMTPHGDLTDLVGFPASVANPIILPPYYPPPWPVPQHQPDLEVLLFTDGPREGGVRGQLHVCFLPLGWYADR